MNRRLAAYAKKVIAMRESGNHPEIIQIVFGYPWDTPYLWPLIGIKPDDYKPGVFDFSVLAGTTVFLFDKSNPDKESRFLDADGWSRFFYLCGECSYYAKDRVYFFDHESSHGLELDKSQWLDGFAFYHSTRSADKTQLIRPKWHIPEDARFDRNRLSKGH